MRLFFKLLAAPFVCILTLTSVFCSFALAVSGAVLGIISSVVFILAVIMMFTVNMPAGIAWLIVSFLISPYGLPKLAGWFVGMLDGINDMLKGFILG